MLLIYDDSLLTSYIVVTLISDC